MLHSCEIDRSLAPIRHVEFAEALEDIEPEEGTQVKYRHNGFKYNLICTRISSTGAVWEKRRTR